MSITIIQKSDLSRPKRNPKVALVLAGGAISGGVFKLGGLMALDSVAATAGRLKGIEQAFRKAGCAAEDIEMTLSLLSLIVLEELHLSNRGYVSLNPGQPPAFVPLVSAWATWPVRHSTSPPTVGRRRTRPSSMRRWVAA